MEPIEAVRGGLSRQAVAMDDGIAASARLIGEIRSGAFATPATRRRRPIVIVIGSEESGASLCARVLSVLGIRMVQRPTGEPGTPHLSRNGAGDARGRSKLAGLHDRILGLFSTGEDLELPVSWWADPRSRRDPARDRGFRQ